jgi:hypothetical protein
MPKALHLHDGGSAPEQLVLLKAAIGTLSWNIDLGRCASLKTMASALRTKDNGSLNVSGEQRHASDNDKPMGFCQWYPYDTEACQL